MGGKRRFVLIPYSSLLLAAESAGALVTFAIADEGIYFNGEQFAFRVVPKAKTVAVNEPT